MCKLRVEDVSLYGSVGHEAQCEVDVALLCIKNTVWLIELLLIYIVLGNILQYDCTCNIESTVCYVHGSISSLSSALHHCPIQSGCSNECQGGGHISQNSIHYSGGVGSVCEGGHKIKVCMHTAQLQHHCSSHYSQWG